MSAAHKTLPLPSYVEVKNTQNGKVAILRVNDRGPFHEGRIIDLSYAAAAKLGVLKHGTAPVEIRLLHIPKPKNDDSWKQRAKHRYYVQLIAVSTKASALQHAAKFSEKLALPTHVVLKDNMYRIRLGPFYDSKQTRHAKKMATKFQINGAFIVIEPTSNEPNTQ